MSIHRRPISLGLEPPGLVGERPISADEMPFSAQICQTFAKSTNSGGAWSNLANIGQIGAHGSAALASRDPAGMRGDRCFRLEGQTCSASVVGGIGDSSILRFSDIFAILGYEPIPRKRR